MGMPIHYLLTSSHTLDIPRRGHFAIVVPHLRSFWTKETNFR